MSAEQESTNTIKKIWKILSTVFSIIGLVNVTEDVHKWGPFLLKTIEMYKKIVYYPLQFITIEVSDFVMDYLFFGIMVSTSVTKPMSWPRRTPEGSPVPIFYGSGKNDYIFYFAMVLLVWPALMWELVKEYLGVKLNLIESTPERFKETTLGFKYLFTVLFVFSIILILSMIINGFVN